ncbi:MAG: hypothetical protein NT009_14495 [Proteobacteria bacterium]|nr:hypothetical protein [Pseudomonadota bacterium]
MKNLKAISVLVLFLGIFLAGCAGSKGPEGPPGAGVTVAVTAEAEGTNCATGGSKVDFKDSEGTVLNSIFVCDGANGDSPVVTAENPGLNCDLGGVKVDYLGTVSFVCNGANGQSVTVTVEVAGANCEAGGLRIVSAAGTNYVCNGAAGVAGQSVAVTVVAAGANCAAGGLKLVSASGTNYVCNGANGQSVTVTVEVAGANCTNGGLKLTSAGGANYVCNGAPGTNGTNGQSVTVTVEPAGPNCPSGGIRVDSAGPTTRYVCNGLNCWDLDGDGVGDPEEDLNLDGFVDVWDCTMVPEKHGTVYGWVLYAPGKPAEGALVYLQGENRYAVTDQAGYYEFDYVGVGAHHRLTATMGDYYLEEEENIQVTNGYWYGVHDLYLHYKHPGLKGDFDLNWADASFAGKTVSDQSGNSVAGAGDVNGDGYDDILIADQWADPNGKNIAGEAYLFYGSPFLKGGYDLSWPDVVFQGKADSDYCGRVVSSAGDVNGDGYDDILISSPNAGGSKGEVYLVYGSSYLPAVWDFAATPPDVIFQGKASNAGIGDSISEAGDVNGDGYDDFLIGAYNADPLGRTNAGETYLVYGRDEQLYEVWPFAITAPSVTFLGIAAGDNSGYAVSEAGDVNGDGFDDILIGAWKVHVGGKSDAGETYLIYGGRSLPASWDLAGDAPNATFQGKAVDDQSGASVSGAGDVNGDGYDDILIGAKLADPSGKSAAGEAYLVYGSATWPANMVQDFSVTPPDVTFQGKAVNNESGRVVSGAGDVNGDGFADILIGAWGASPSGRPGAGETYLIYGGKYLPATWDFSGVSPDVVFQGKSIGDSSAYSVAGAGDVNGDGYADILIGATTADPPGRTSAGETYLVYGGLDPENYRHRELAGDFKVREADNLFLGAGINGKSGWSAALVGDVNGDGYDDILIGAWDMGRLGRFHNGEAYLYYGKPGLKGAHSINFPESMPSQPDVKFIGIKEDDNLGYSVSGAGDLNADGYDEILIGAPGAWGGKGEAYVIYGGNSMTPGTIWDFSTWSPQITITGKAAGDILGWSVSGAGDVNGDGYSDMLIGAPGADPSGRINAGEAYIIYGARVLSSTWDLSVTPPDVTFQGQAAGDGLGWSVSGAGDVNRDGFADILLGAYQASPGAKPQAGEAYLIYGSNSLPAAWDLSTTPAGAAFLGKNSGDQCGSSVSGAGDFNGDGYADILLGAPFTAVGVLSGAGEAYLVYGTALPLGTKDLAITPPDVTFQGRDTNGNLGGSVNKAGDVNRDGLADTIMGAPAAGAAGEGEADLVYGRAQLFGTWDFSSIPPDADFQGAGASDYCGGSVSGGGDVNGDGFDDLLIGAYLAAPLTLGNHLGETYLFYGSGRRALD